MTSNEEASGASDANWIASLRAELRQAARKDVFILSRDNVIELMGETSISIMSDKPGRPLDALQGSGEVEAVAEAFVHRGMVHLVYRNEWLMHEGHQPLAHGTKLYTHPDGWWPIESAPLDGTTVDIWVPYGEGKGFRIINTSWKHHDWMNGKPRSPKAWDRSSPDGPLPEPSHWRLPPPEPGQPDPGIAVPLGSWTLDGRWRHNGRLQMSEQDQRAHNVKHGFMKCTHGVTVDDSASDTGRRCMLCNEPTPAIGEAG